MIQSPTRKSAAFDTIRSGIRILANQRGFRVGFPTDTARAALPHVVSYSTLSRERMGDRRFARVYRVATGAAEHIAGRLGYLVEPIRDHQGILVGREFRFADSLAALRFKLHVDAALSGRSLRIAEVTT
jgi:hypothetical protein